MRKHVHKNRCPGIFKTYSNSNGDSPTLGHQGIVEQYSVPVVSLKSANLASVFAAITIYLDLKTKIARKTSFDEVALVEITNSIWW